MAMCEPEDGGEEEECRRPREAAEGVGPHPRGSSRLWLVVVTLVSDVQAGPLTGALCRRGRDAPKIVGYNPEMQNAKSETEAEREKKEKRHRGVCRDQVTRTQQTAQDARRDRCRARATAGGRHSGAGHNYIHGKTGSHGMGAGCRLQCQAWQAARMPSPGVLCGPVPRPSLCSASLALPTGIASWPNLAMLICERPGSPRVLMPICVSVPRPCQPNWASSSKGRARSRARRKSSSLPTYVHLLHTNTHRIVSHRSPCWPPVIGPSRSLTEPGLPRCRPARTRPSGCLQRWPLGCPPSICNPETGSWGDMSRIETRGQTLHGCRSGTSLANPEYKY